MSKKELKKYKDKLRLYYILHGIMKNDVIYFRGCLICKTYGGEGRPCKRGDSDKVLILEQDTLELFEMDVNKAIRKGIQGRCVEWVRHV